VLDDVPDVATAIATVLSDGGYEVAETNAPEIAIETIEEDPDGWACLITDYDMPEMNGGDLIARLEQTVPDLPVIVVSALARRLTDRRLSNAVAVLQKPVNKDKLLAAVLEATT
jgi:CheY-like chemotaxis protein